MCIDSFTITIRTHFFAKKYLLLRYNETFDTLIHDTSSETFANFCFALFQLIESVRPVKASTSTTIFSSLTFHCASRCLLWFDTTLLCLMLVSFFNIGPQFECQFRWNQLHETSVLCGFCLPQVMSDLLQISITMFFRNISRFSAYHPKDFAFQFH